MLKIEAVDPVGTGAGLNLQPGDRLIAIGGKPLEDILDFHLLLGDCRLRLEVLRQDGELWELDLEKDPQDDLGLQLEHPQPTQCGNNCLFCFVHQLPKGMRRSLYVKDEDYRFSYLYGSYITLSNLDQPALQRIVEQRLSPLYVSVHATDEQLRARLLGRQAPPILALLQQLTRAGIEIHCQIVLCPGLNDGAVLQESIEALYRLHPGVRSLAVVPVGLTSHRERLPDLRRLTPAEAVATLELIHACQQRYLRATDSRFVFAADEIYLQAKVELPELECYEELWQVENGVGMLAQFRTEALEVLEEAEPLELGEVSLLTGRSFHADLSRFAGQLAEQTGVRIRVHRIDNGFFGEQVTVAGLLTGQDLQQQLTGRELGQGLLVPEVMLKEDEEIFLDDLPLQELAERLRVPVVKIASSPWGILEGLEQLADGPVDIVRC